MAGGGKCAGEHFLLGLGDAAAFQQVGALQRMSFSGVHHGGGGDGVELLAPSGAFGAEGLAKMFSVRRQGRSHFVVRH